MTADETAAALDRLLPDIDELVPPPIETYHARPTRQQPPPCTPDPGFIPSHDLIGDQQ